jgi:hypothetical protein
MKHLLLLSLFSIGLFSSNENAEIINDKLNSKKTAVELGYQEDETFTKESVLGKWTIVEFESYVDGEYEMIGKTFEFTTDSLTYTYIDINQLKTITTTYEIYSESVIKIDRTSSTGAKLRKKYSGFIQKGKMRLNSNQGSFLLKKNK